MAAWTRQHTKWEAMEILGRAGVPCGPVLDTKELLENEHMRARGAVVEVEHPVRGRWEFIAPPFRLSASQVPVRPAPLLGQHTEEVLAAELGLSPQELARLAEIGVTAPRMTATAAVSD